MPATFVLAHPDAHCAGGQDGKVRVFDLTTGQQASEFQAAADTVNGLSCHQIKRENEMTA